MRELHDPKPTVPKQITLQDPMLNDHDCRLLCEVHLRASHGSGLLLAFLLWFRLRRGRRQRLGSCCGILLRCPAGSKDL